MAYNWLVTNGMYEHNTMTMCKNAHRFLGETMIKLKINPFFMLLLLQFLLCPMNNVSCVAHSQSCVFCCVCLPVFAVLSGWRPIVFDLIPSYVIFRAESSSKRINNIHYYYALGIFTTCFRLLRSLSRSLSLFLVFCSVEKWLKCNLYLSLSRLDQLSVQVQQFRRKMGTNGKTNEISSVRHGTEMELGMCYFQWWIRQTSAIFEKDVYYDDKIKWEERENECCRSGHDEASVTRRLGINLLLHPLDAICSCQMMVQHHQDNDTNKNRIEEQEKIRSWNCYSHCSE